MPEINLRKYKLRQGNISIAEHFSDYPDHILCKKENGEHFKHEELYGIAERINPKRQFLFVSKILARHIPVEVDDPLIKEAYKSLASALSVKLKAFGSQKILMLSMAETATQMAPKIAEYLPECNEIDLNDPNINIRLIHSTREPNQNAITCTFNEGHSHQSLHYIQQIHNKSIDTLVLIDDEYSTGKTLLSALYGLWSAGIRPKNVITMSFLDWRENSNGILDFISSNIGVEGNYCSIALARGKFKFSEKKISIEELSEIDRCDNKNDVTNDCAYYGKILYPEDLLSFKAEQPIESVFKYNLAIQNEAHLGVSEDNQNNWDKLQKEVLTEKRELKYLVVAAGENHFLSDKIAQNLKGSMKNKRSEVYLSSITRSPILCSAIIRNDNFFTQLLKEHTDTHFNDLLSDSVIKRKRIFPKFNNQVDRYLYNVNIEAYDRVIFIIEDKLKDIHSEELKALSDKYQNVIIFNDCRIIDR